MALSPDVPSNSHPTHTVQNASETESSENEVSFRVAGFEIM